MNILFLTNNFSISQELIDTLTGWNDFKVIVSDKKVNKDSFIFSNVDWIVSYGYMHIIPENILDMVQYRAVNLHVSLLPWNMGSDSNLWSFIKNTPKGVTIHMIDKGIDTGAIVVQKECFFDEQKETLSSSYQYLNKVIRSLFCDSFPLLIKGKIKPQPQIGAGSIHRMKDMEEFKEYLGSTLYEIPICDLKEQYHMFSLCHSNGVMIRYLTSFLLKSIQSDVELKKEFLSALISACDLRKNDFHPLVFINGKPKVGENVSIGIFSEINANLVGISIGDNCDIASFVAINTADSHLRCFGSSSNIDRKPIVLENNVFVGSHAFIGGGTRIGHHSVVGAGTILVNGGDIPPYSLIIGNPAEIKKGYYKK